MFKGSSNLRMGHGLLVDDYKEGVGWESGWSKTKQKGSIDWLKLARALDKRLKRMTACCCLLLQPQCWSFQASLLPLNPKPLDKAGASLCLSVCLARSVLVSLSRGRSDQMLHAFSNAVVMKRCGCVRTTEIFVKLRRKKTHIDSYFWTHLSSLQGGF